PSQAFERLGHAAINRGCIVLDDGHKATDSLAFELVCSLVSRHWSGCHLILISERKLPAAAALSIDEIPLTGLTPRESLLFATKLGLDLRLVRRNRGWIPARGVCQVCDRGRVRGHGRCGSRRIFSW